MSSWGSSLYEPIQAESECEEMIKSINVQSQ